MIKIGFIGLGKMGGGLARNLIRSGYEVVLYDINPDAIENMLKVGGEKAESPESLATSVDVLFTSLPLPKHLLDLLTGENGLLCKMKSGSTVIDVSTIDPKTAREVSDAAGVSNIQFLACPLGKGPVQAEEGTQPIYAGGERKVFLLMEGLLNKMSTSVHYLGDVEQATGFKLISNMVGMTNALVLFEGLRIGEEIGIEPQLLQELLATTGADSYQLTLRGPKVLNKDYSPGFSTNLTLKDLTLGVNMANDLQHKSQFSSLAKQCFEIAQKNGYGEEDCAAAYEVFNKGD